MINNIGASTLRPYVTKFTSSGTFTLPSGYGSTNPLTVEALVVGGGGGAAGQHTPGASQVLFGGGGGGGAVRSDIITLTASAPITIGLGGSLGFNADTHNPNAGNGMFSAVNATVKNMWINPQCLRQSTNNSAPFLSPHEFAYQGGTFTQSNTGGNISGGTYLWGNATTIHSRPYRLTAGTQYTWSAYFKANTTGQTVDVQAKQMLTTAKTGSVVATASTGATALTNAAWVRVSLTWTQTAATDATIVRLVGAGSANTISISNIMLEAAASASTYADGDTSGCAWVGPRDGSETVTSGTYVAVPGGGGGAQQMQYNSTPTQSTICSGFVGATGGGSPTGVHTTSYTAALGGCGGGAGGHATPHSYLYVGTAITTLSGPMPTQAPWGMGSAGFSTSAANDGTKQLIYGMPGPGIGEYGKGGLGGRYAGATGASLYDTQLAAPGAGGNGPVSELGSSGTSWLGNNGADGVVILRYWA